MMWILRLAQWLVSHTSMKLQRVSTLELQMGRFKPLQGPRSSHLPAPLKAKKAPVNVQNKDQECFKWAVLSMLFPPCTKLTTYPTTALREARGEARLEWLDLFGAAR